MQKTPIIIIAQLFISLMMAFAMTGIFSLLDLVFSLAWLHTWATRFIVAWPIAFCLSLVIGNLGFKIAFKVSNLLKLQSAAQ
ncbi:DUF2798 domain-containing protein [Craterilacuibacter sinensis]|uniref:DUF2798 domain-containing protein n=1 Tax=Craterilacuibacter sinensis TaxID=2686017 RepID=A0A845BM66_9NEIS|nr:DUF2798 domain-containing protein [Craterilacuibacter sinensis]MXR36364.1 DUF2798 domain-containing protein [Craterilacuibacter sinensis]